MSGEITIGIQIGRVMFSFQTDDKGSNVRSAVKNIKQIATSYSALFNNLGLEAKRKVVDTSQELPRPPAQRKGKAETSLILRKLEEVIARKEYFRDARTTGDVKGELKKQSGIDFTSRKVSQALGLLFQKSMLSRVGAKGSFRYIQQ